MQCEVIREALSARIDGEQAAIGDREIEAHLTGCSACRAWEASATLLNRTFRVEPATPMPDIWPAVRSAAAVARTDRPVGDKLANASRWLLAVLALMQLVVAIPAIVLGEGNGLTTHLARDLGSWDVALAVGFLYAAWRPARIAGMLPLVGALVACLIVTSAIDVWLGRTAALQESGHSLDLIGLGLLWLVSHRPATAGGGARVA
jgi:predicted anti-sigma-YlaC factor YlaD